MSIKRGLSGYCTKLNFSRLMPNLSKDLFIVYLTSMYFSRLILLLYLSLKSSQLNYLLVNGYRKLEREDPSETNSGNSEYLTVLLLVT